MLLLARVIVNANANTVAARAIHSHTQSILYTLRLYTNVSIQYVGSGPRSRIHRKQSPNSNRDDAKGPNENSEHVYTQIYTVILLYNIMITMRRDCIRC